MATKHINAQPGDFAETVLLPGDPLRAQFIAENYLEDARRVNDVRNMWGYTGRYRGERCSVMASGMGNYNLQTSEARAHLPEKLTTGSENMVGRVHG